MLVKKTASGIANPRSASPYTVAKSAHNQARRALKSRSGLAITEIAGEMGFSSASHFTYHYKAMFDELPSQTLRIGC